jgi:ATP/maltotriose-dependent transcriptional regulator MalT
MQAHAVDRIERVAARKTVDPQLIAALVAGKGHTASTRLSELELQVLSLMAEGLSNAALGKRVHSAPEQSKTGDFDDLHQARPTVRHAKPSVGTWI